MTPKVLIANRGVIARRIIRTVRKLGWRSVLACSEADAETLPAREADERVIIGPPPAASSYLDAAKILNAARHAGCSIIHPGYGFLSENADFAEACEAEGFAFAGPSPAQIRMFGLKTTAREAAARCGVPLLPGTGLLETTAEAIAAAENIGWPVMLKSAAGGGGIGMRICRDEISLTEACESVRRLSEANFRHGGVFLEKFVAEGRHIEAQVFGDGAGRVLVLGERDCSAQRRNQKVLEEAPAPHLPEALRQELHEAAARLLRSVNYRSAGTVEFLYDAAEGRFYFLEVNTRLQVEHGVTEEIFGVDLVEWMLRLAAGDASFLDEPPGPPRGHAIQARIYAEVPAKNFQPSTGLLIQAEFPAEVRIETWVEPGAEVTAYYDPMLAKVIAAAATREAALSRLETALAHTRLAGVETNLLFLRNAIASEPFHRGGVSTRFLSQIVFEPLLAEVLDGGLETLVVDWPGRTGYWEVGVPPSGPFDDRSFRSANRALGNPEGMAGLEFTLRGPSLRFLSPAWCCLAGAEFHAKLDGAPVACGKPFLAPAGSVLRLGMAQGPGLRGCLAVRGGLEVPEYLGSKTTFPLGQFGGHGGRALRTGDFLRLAPGASEPPPHSLEAATAKGWGNRWEIGVMCGPHAAPEFLTAEGVEEFFSTDWEVHYNSARTGVRLIGPKPKWARPDGGEAGLHPSNIHDNAYQVGSVDFTGDMPVILGPDGPSLGGFVCPATVLSSELWKVGQLRPGDRVRFVPVPEQAQEGSPPLTVEESGHAGPEHAGAPWFSRREAVLLWEENDVTIRKQGDTGMLVEFGPMVLDLALRFRVQALYERLKETRPAGMLDLTPGIRSLQVRHDPAKLPTRECLAHVREAIASLPELDNFTTATRIVRIPLSWDDPATRLAIEKYMRSVRADAPWCPSNLEFIRRINGLDSIEEVKRIVFGASYLVLGLGDVYLGAPVATPLDPRHRLVTTKYNPARTWTPENAVGIGGAYLCIYGMEGPGGYQFVGRTVPVWNRYHVTRSFEPGRPWLLRFFDQIRFYEVSAEELLELRRQILTGQYEPEIENAQFRFHDYQEFLKNEAPAIAAFRERQRRAFAEERERWAAQGQDTADFSEPVPEAAETILQPGEIPACSPAAGSVWKVLVTEGETVAEGQPVAIIESMKTEIPCVAPAGGKVARVFVQPGKVASPGQHLLAIKP